MSATTNPQLHELMGTGPPPGLGTLGVIRWGAKNPPQDPQASFAGKVVLVTGANSGIGYNTCVKFVKLGASKVILAVRSSSKGDLAKAQMVAEAEYEGDIDRIVVMQLDMNDFQSVKKFATNVEQEVGGDGLDAAILNAGVAPCQYRAVDKTGWESGLQVNVLSTALLAICLMPLLKRAAQRTGRPSQLTMTSSYGFLSVKPTDIPAGTPSVLHSLNEPGSFRILTSYIIGKLLTLYIMHGLMDDYQDTFPPSDEPGSQNGHRAPHVAVNVICPGFTVTDIGRDYPWYLAITTKLMQMYGGRSAEEGSRTLVSAALLGAGGHGKFWTNDTFLDPGYMVTSEEGQRLQERVWKEIRDICMKELDS